MSFNYASAGLSITSYAIGSSGRRKSARLRSRQRQYQLQALSANYARGYEQDSRAISSGYATMGASNLSSKSRSSHNYMRQLESRLRGDRHSAYTNAIKSIQLQGKIDRQASRNQETAARVGLVSSATTWWGN